ncbi:MAG: hypothetical protein JW915_12685 [Chitinispirillaceae bacterium]|nr:hypothetical protein [Chitinispirillaceae bacterium]
MEIVAAGQNITSKNSVAEIKVIISNKGNKTVRVMDELEITTNKNHRCYALYVKIINHKNIQMNFALNGFDIFGHSGFKYVKLQPGDTIKTTFQINFRELFLERVGNPNLNFGTYTITVTLRDLYKNIVPEITSSPLYISYQNDVGLIVGDEGKTSEPLNKKK